MRRVYVIAELGINHNGSVDQAKALMDAAKQASADAVKFQKRTVEVVYTPEELARPRDSPFGTTNGDLKRGLEFGPAEYDEIFAYATHLGLACSASCWDAASVDMIAAYQPPWLKVPSACLTDHALLRAYARTGLPLYVSTGMSTEAEIDHAVAVLRQEGCPDVTLLHCTSTYPTALDELNLAYLPVLRERTGYPVGFSSHAVSPWPCVYAAVLGATVIEAHLTLDRTLWGSDQAASLEPAAFGKMVQEIQDLERILGDGVKRVYASEEPIKAKLRRVHA